MVVCQWSFESGYLWRETMKKVEFFEDLDAYHLAVNLCDRIWDIVWIGKSKSYY
jgi:hypothetical protein